MAKIAHRILAHGDGWSVRDIVCGAGPQDRPFEEQHANVSVSIVAGGSFEYRSASGRDLLTPGSLLLANAGQAFECSHEHGTGDRCISFQFAPEFFGDVPRFRSPRLPAIRATSSLVANACAGLGGSSVSWQWLAIALADRAIELQTEARPAPSHAIARVTRAVRAIEAQADDALDVAALARETNLSPFHFLRTFQRVTGVTPHQYLLRTRLRNAAVRLASRPAKIADVAFESGFGDVSNFNRTFRAEFGVSPRTYRSRNGEAIE